MKFIIMLLILLIGCECNESEEPPAENQKGGVQIIITNNLEPIEIYLQGHEDEIYKGHEMVMQAKSDNAENVNYTWYLNGCVIQIGENCNLGAGLTEGLYRLDVTGFTEDNRRGGGISHTFMVLK